MLISIVPNEDRLRLTAVESGDHALIAHFGTVFRQIPKPSQPSRLHVAFCPVIIDNSDRRSLNTCGEFDRLHFSFPQARVRPIQNFSIVNSEIDRPNKHPGGVENDSRGLLVRLATLCTLGPATHRGIYVIAPTDPMQQYLDIFWGYCALCEVRPQAVVTFAGNIHVCCCAFCQEGCAHKSVSRNVGTRTCRRCGSHNIAKKKAVFHASRAKAGK